MLEVVIFLDEIVILCDTASPAQPPVSDQSIEDTAVKFERLVSSGSYLSTPTSCQPRVLMACGATLLLDKCEGILLSSLRIRARLTSMPDLASGII